MWRPPPKLFRGGGEVVWDGPARAQTCDLRARPHPSQSPIPPRLTPVLSASFVASPPAFSGCGSCGKGFADFRDPRTAPSCPCGPRRGPRLSPACGCPAGRIPGRTAPAAVGQAAVARPILACCTSSANAAASGCHLACGRRSSPPTSVRSSPDVGRAALVCLPGLSPPALKQNKKRPSTVMQFRIRSMGAGSLWTLGRCNIDFDLPPPAEAFPIFANQICAGDAVGESAVEYRPAVGTDWAAVFRCLYCTT